jgi:hypothetical protein
MKVGGVYECLKRKENGADVVVLFFHRFWGQAKPGAITRRHELCFLFLKDKIFFFFCKNKKIQQSLQFSLICLQNKILALIAG